MKRRKVRASTIGLQGPEIINEIKSDLKHTKAKLMKVQGKKKNFIEKRLNYTRK